MYPSDILDYKYKNELKEWIDSLEDVIHVWEDSSNDSHYKCYYVVTNDQMIRVFGMVGQKANVSLDRQI